MREDYKMDKKEVLKKLESIFADVFANDDILLNEDTSANDIEDWDSLTHIIILEAIQDEYGVKFDLDEIIEMKTVGDMINAIINK